MTRRRPIDRLRLFLYGTPHLVGSGAVLIGLALYFAGVVDAGWWAILLGLYVGGYLIANGFVPDEAIGNDLDEARLLHDVENLVATGRSRLPESLRARLDSILEQARTLIPILDDLSLRGIIGERVRHDVLAGLTRYLPDTLGRYLALPPAYLKLHQSGPRSPVSMLDEQLALIDQHLSKCLEEAFGEHASELAIQGRFLAEKMADGRLP